MSFLNAPKPFLETNAWQHGNINSLRYNTSQAGSILPLGYGTFRQQVNLIGFGDYRGPSGKKGKNGPLPITGTHVGKGGSGAGKKGTGGKKNGDYSIDVDFAICQGPVDIGDTNLVWSSNGSAFFQSVGLNLYTGDDGQASDPVFAGLGQDVGYSGTCHVTGTPMDLGSSPVLPNLSFEVTGFEVGTCGTSFPKDANPASVVEDFLINIRYGAGWPIANLDPNIAVLGVDSYRDYCQAAGLPVSPVLQVQTEAAAWISELAKLTNTAILWSGKLLKFIPYGDIALDAYGTTWAPNLTPVYSFTDDDFLPWNPHLDTAEVILREDDPVIVTRTNPADAINWISIEYLDRINLYNKTVVAQFDQGTIDLYGLKTQASIQGNCFCNKTAAAVSARLILQRLLYIRNFYKFQVGWKYALLEPMDIVLLTDEKAGLVDKAVRITKIEENENGDLIIEGEEIETGGAIVPGPPPPPASLYVDAYGSPLSLGLTGAIDSPKGLFSIYILPDDFSSHLAQPVAGLFRHYIVDPFNLPPAFEVLYNYSDGSIFVAFGGRTHFDYVYAVSAAGVVVADGNWHNLLVSWDMSTFTIQLCYDGVLIPLTVTQSTTTPFDCAYAGAFWEVFSAANYTPTYARYFGGAQDLYFNTVDNLDLNTPTNVQKFWAGGLGKRLGANGELPTGSSPIVLLHYTGTGPTEAFANNFGTGGDFYNWGYPLGTVNSNPYGE